MMNKIARVQVAINIIVILSILFRVLQVLNLSKLFGLGDLGGYIWTSVSHCLGLVAFLLDNILCYLIIIEFIFHPLIDAKKSLKFRNLSKQRDEKSHLKVDIQTDRNGSLHIEPNENSNDTVQ